MEPETRHCHVTQELFFMLLGAMLIALPLVTWDNSIALLYGTGLFFGPAFLGGRARSLCGFAR